MSTHSIFLNYRRIETQKDARHLYRELLRHFPEQIFMDAPGTAGGQHFPDLLRRKVQECRVLVAVIGPEWHRLTDGSGRVRLDQEDDWVRLEIAAALQRGIPVIPALIDGAGMPAVGQVPAVLHALLNHQAVKLDLDDFFEASIEKLCVAIQLALAAKTTTPASPLRHSRESGNPRTEPKLLTLDPRLRRDDGMRGGVALVAPPAAWAMTQSPTLVDPPWSDVDDLPLLASPPWCDEPVWAMNDGCDSFEMSWADMEIGGVVQRLRWIEPRSFLIGCDPGDPDGYEDEKPHHRVTLTKGYWLADTACTQGLWQAVTGQNPSHFKGRADLPVENVSWDDVTGLFLPKVAQRLGVSAELPTEAEWEFACRAGMQAPYWFGQNISKKQANFDGKVGKTVPVKGRPANGWGLYQMHGNVWEWCAGSQRQYSAQAAVNPPDGQDQNSRALRGGSWDLPARCARSAYRSVSPRDLRHQSRGFRFSLRSIKPSR